MTPIELWDGVTVDPTKIYRVSIQIPDLCIAWYCVHVYLTCTPEILTCRLSTEEEADEVYGDVNNKWREAVKEKGARP